MEMIRITCLDKKYGHKQIFKGLNASFKKGKASIVWGPSGCGKTTLLRLIAGFEKPDCGEVFINSVKASSPHILLPSRKRGINMVFQNLALWPHMTVHEHLSFVLKARKVPKALHKDKMLKIINIVGLNDNGKSYPAQLSGGERQRLAIARALVVENPILLLDEPLSHIHPELKLEILKLIKRIKREFNLTMIYVTHNIGEGRYIGDELFVFENGKLKKVRMAKSKGNVNTAPGIFCDFGR
jgi:ABC-type Fe3+/spermidine/putrescine transport system ATPase subunit